MTTTKPHNQPGGATFVPPDGDESERWSGRKRKVAAMSAVEMRWPKIREQQGKLFDTWHGMAAQILHRGQHSFRLLAVIYKFLNWETGTLWPSNATLAEHAGGCSAKTIQRDVELYKSLGLIACFEASRKGAKHPIRVIKLTLPKDLDAEIFVPNDIEQMDTSCPPDRFEQMDTSCPEQMDTSCPPTFEETFERRPTRPRTPRSR